MLELKKTPEHTIDRVFLLALLALFAATAFLVVSIGAKQYHSITDSMTANYETRTVSSYLGFFFITKTRNVGNNL